jgi:hypothetical protein
MNLLYRCCAGLDIHRDRVARGERESGLVAT